MLKAQENIKQLPKASWRRWHFSWVLKRARVSKRREFGGWPFQGKKARWAKTQWGKSVCWKKIVSVIWGAVG